jgi:nucleoside-diphosphate-sugar epimerase
MRIAITGATGFLGRYIVRQLAAAGHELYCWYRKTSDRSGFDKASHAITWLPGDLGEDSAAEQLVKGMDAVVHSALARPKGQGFMASGPNDLMELARTNLLGSLKLFSTAFHVGVSRFVFISTCAVHDVILGDRPLDEKHPLWPKSDYGAHKAALEAFVHSFGLGGAWPICALRPTGIYGLAQPPRSSRWYDLVGQVLSGEKIATARGGKEVHAADVARAVELLLRADAATIAGQSYNCYDFYIAEQEVALIAKELSRSTSEIADLNRGPKNQIDTQKLRALGMSFGGKELLRRTIGEMIEAQRKT